MRSRTVTVSGRGDVRAYAAVDVAAALGVTAKTVVAWIVGHGRAGSRLSGWAPRTVDPGERRWLVDADEVDAELAARRAAPAGALDDERRQLDEARRLLADERRRLTDERQLFELERAVHVQERIERLEADNARLTAEARQLRTHLAALGTLVADLTADAPTTTTDDRPTPF